MTGPVEPSRRRIWLGVWGGGLAWAAHFAAIYLLAEFGCTGSLAEHQPLGVSLVAWLVLAATAVALLAAGAAIRLGWVTAGRARQRAPDEAGLEADAPPGAANELFAGRFAWIAGSLFAVSIAFQAVPVLYYLRACGVAVLP